MANPPKFLGGPWPRWPMLWRHPHEKTQYIAYTKPYKHCIACTDSGTIMLSKGQVGNLQQQLTLLIYTKWFICEVLHFLWALFADTDIKTNTIYNICNWSLSQLLPLIHCTEIQKLSPTECNKAKLIKSGHDFKQKTYPARTQYHAIPYSQFHVIFIF
jgi:hypothetical protein